MDKFGYNKAWKAHKFMACGYPVIGLLGMLAIGLFVIWPSSSDSFYRVKFTSWAPAAAVALAVWAFLAIQKFRRALVFSVELSEEMIRVCGDGVKWSDITRVESRGALGDGFAVILHTTSGSRMGIPAATVNLAHIRAFIDAHANNAR